METTTTPHDDLPIAPADALLGNFERRFTCIPVPQLGMRFRIRNLTELERSRFENGLLNAKGRLRADRVIQVKARLIQITVVDDEGNLRYAERDIPKIIGQDSIVINALVNGIKEHCGMNEDDLDQLATV